MGDFFVTENEEMEKQDNIVMKETQSNSKNENSLQKQTTKKAVENIISSQYVPIKLDSLGKLDAPKIIHVRNYLMEDALELSLANEETSLEITLKVLQGMVKEDFDVSLLHEEELKEILLTIYANFWSQEIPNYYFPLIEEDYPLLYSTFPKEEADAYKNGNKFLKINIPISNIKTVPINKQFAEPIKIKTKDNIVYFRLSRVGDVLISKKYVEDLFITQERKFSDIKYEIENGNMEKVPNNILQEYQNYLRQKSLLLIKVVQAQLIEGINDEKFETLEDKLNNYNKIDIKMWNKYNDIIEKYATFGINPEVEVIHPLTKKPVVRRFQFRYLDFIQTLDLQDNTEYTVEFGN